MNPTTERIDRRYSDERAQAVSWADAEARLVAAEVAWVVTVRPDGRPHATPMVPVVLDGRVCFQTGKNEVKYTNLEGNPHVLVLAGDTAWDRGLDVAVEGTIVPVTEDESLRRIAELYRSRWDGRWHLDVQDCVVYNANHSSPAVVFEVTPSRAFGHAKGDPFGQTTYRL